MRADREDFARMVNQLSSAARVYCASGKQRKILFQDGDFATPYIAGDAGPLGRCEVVRVTAVTPLTNDELDDCGNLFVRESAPLGSYRFERGFVTDPILQAYNWPELSRWTSEDGRYSFTIYLHPCAAPGDRKE